MNDEQAQALGRLAQSQSPNVIRLEYEPFDLPAGSVMFVIERPSGVARLTGGILPDGGVHT